MNRQARNNVTVLGCGRWGSFHAWYQSKILKNNALMWGRAQDECFHNVQKSRKNNFVDLPDDIAIITDLQAALDHAEYIIVSISAQAVRDLAQNIAACNPKNKTFILCMKGICQRTGERLSQIIQSHVDETNKICVWVGPGHVQDFTSGQPNVMVIAATDITVASNVATAFSSDLIKLYINNDLVGAEIGAAAKNVMGIAAGMLDGAHAQSLKGALMTRGTHEVSRLIKAMGGDIMTAYGLSHLGDFDATLYSQESNNRTYGEEFYRAWEEKREPKSRGLAEGISSSEAFMVLAGKYNVEMPICKMVYQILYQGLSPRQAFREWFNRALAHEFRY
jgi:glycerol-3-phosphate dehydrogenase (NAD(P)+)